MIKKLRAKVSIFIKCVTANGHVTALEASNNVIAYNPYTSKYWANWRIKVFSIKGRHVSLKLNACGNTPKKEAT